LIFTDRNDAGSRLGQRLKQLLITKPLLVSIPRGGIPVAAAAAKVTGWPMVVFVARKLRCPSQPELAFGAVTESGPAFLNPSIMASIGLTKEDRDEEIARQRTECARRRILFADCHLSTNDPETTPILIDDGIATGATAIAALRTLRSLGFHRVLCAVPVCSRDSAASIEAECDDLITLDRPEGFMGIGQFYVHFPQLDDLEAQAICRKAISDSKAIPQ